MDARVIPPHVPKHLVFDFDYIAATKTAGSSPFPPLFALDEQGLPDIFWSPLHGGHWVTRRYAALNEIFRDHEHFSTHPMVIPPMKDQPVKMIPMEIDPPDHQRFRRVMGPLFTPVAARRSEKIIRDLAVSLADRVAARGECDFVAAFANKLPPLAFLGFMGMPTERVDEFVGWASASLVGEPEEQAAAGQKIIAFVSEYVESKYASPGDDWASALITAKEADGSPALTRDELVNISYFLFLGGLDTVLNSLSHAWRYLAETPDAQAELRNNPDLIPGAVEEFLRINTIVNNSRRVRKDLRFEGIDFKAGDAVLMLSAVANRDPRQFEAPNKVDFTREVNPHLTFGMGVHRCLGSNIARMEMRIALEEWFKRIPAFHLKPRAEIHATGGVTMGLQNLPLAWEPMKP
jgi:cytochrome P450